MASSKNVLKEILPEVLAARDILARDDRKRIMDMQEALADEEARKAYMMRHPELHKPLPSEPVEIKEKNFLTDPNSWLNRGLGNLAGNAASVILGEPSGNGLVDLGAANVPGVGAGAILAAGGMPGIVDVVPGAGTAAKAVRRLPEILAREKKILSKLYEGMKPAEFVNALNTRPLEKAREEFRAMAKIAIMMERPDAFEVFTRAAEMENPREFMEAAHRLGINSKEELYKAFPEEFADIIAEEAAREKAWKESRWSPEFYLSTHKKPPAVDAEANKRLQDINNAYNNFEVQLKKLEKNPQKYLSKAEASGKSIDEMLAIPPELPEGVSREALEARKAAALEKAAPVPVEAPAAPVEAPAVPQAPAVDLKAQRAAEKAAKEAEKQARRKARQEERRAAEEAERAAKAQAPQQPPRRPYEAPSMSSVETPGSSRILMSVAEPEAQAAKTVANLTDAERSFMDRVGGVIASKPAWKKMDPYLKENGLTYKDVRKYNELKALSEGRNPYDWQGNGWKSSEHPLGGGLDYSDVLPPNATEGDRRAAFVLDSLAGETMKGFRLKSNRDALYSGDANVRRHQGTFYDEELSPRFNEEVLYSLEKGNLPANGRTVRISKGWNPTYNKDQANIESMQDLYDKLFRARVQKAVDQVGGYR